MGPPISSEDESERASADSLEDELRGMEGLTTTEGSLGAGWIGVGPGGGGWTAGGTAGSVKIDCSGSFPESRIVDGKVGVAASAGSP